MKKLGVVLGFLACVMFVGSVMAAEPGRLVKGRYVMSVKELPLLSFQLDNGAELTTSTTPGLEEDDNIPGIVWADGETSPVQQTFMVPGDYLGDGRFRVFASVSNATTQNNLDFDVYSNRDGVTPDTAATNQTTVNIDQVSGYTAELSLVPVTDFDSLKAYDWVTIRIWRDDTAIGTGDAEVKGVAFLYTPIGD